MNKIEKLIQNCLLEVEYQDEQWNDLDTAHLIAEKIKKVMLDFSNFIGDESLTKVDIYKKGEYQYQKWGAIDYLDNDEDNTLFEDELLDEFLYQYELDLFKP